MAKELSRKPNSVRRRLSQHRADPERDKAILIEEGLLKPLAEWDLEELGRGRARNSSGSFSGSSPRWLREDIEKERRRRLKDATFNALMMHVPAALAAIGKMISDPDTPASVKTDIAKFMYEQLHGKAAARVDLAGRVDFTHQAIASAIVLDDGQDQDTARYELADEDD